MSEIFGSSCMERRLIELIRVSDGRFARMRVTVPSYRDTYHCERNLGFLYPVSSTQEDTRNSCT